MACPGIGGTARGDAPVVSQELSFGALVLPLVAALGYACGAIAVKRALWAGLSGSWVNFVCNSSMAVLFQIFWFFPGGVSLSTGLVAPAVDVYKRQDLGCLGCSDGRGMQCISIPVDQGDEEDGNRPCQPGKAFIEFLSLIHILSGVRNPWGKEISE